MFTTTQLVLRTDIHTIEWLESKGYRNAQSLPIEYKFPVFIVDLPSKTFYGTNTTCMSAACSCGFRPKILALEDIIDSL